MKSNGRMQLMVIDQGDCVSLSVVYCISTALVVSIINIVQVHKVRYNVCSVDVSKFGDCFLRFLLQKVRGVTVQYKIIL